MPSPNTLPLFGLTPNIGMITISTANTNRDGTGTIGTVLTAGINGTRVDRIEIIAIGNTTNNIVRLFIDNGSVKKLEKEVLVPLTTPGTTVLTFMSTVSYPNGLVIPSGFFVDASTNNAESYNIIALGADY